MRRDIYNAKQTPTRKLA